MFENLGSPRFSCQMCSIGLVIYVLYLKNNEKKNAFILIIKRCANKRKDDLFSKGEKNVLHYEELNKSRIFFYKLNSFWVVFFNF
jgi:hypothetical protein